LLGTWSLSTVGGMRARASMGISLILLGSVVSNVFADDTGAE